MLESPLEGSSRGNELSLDGLWALDATGDCVLIFDRDLRVLYANERAAALNGKTRQDLVGRLHDDAWPQTVGTDVVARYREVMATGIMAEFDAQYHEGEGVDVWHEIRAVPHAGGLAVFYRDVTEARRRDAAEREDRERLASLVRATDVGVWYCELPDVNQPLHWSDQVRRHFGITDGRSVRLSECFEIIHPDDRGPTAVAMERAIQDRVPFDVVYRTQGLDGKQRTIHATGSAFYREDGTPYRFDGLTVDLTERMQTEYDLRQAKAQIESVLASSDIATWRYDPATDTIFGDANLFAMFGLPQAIGLTAPFSEFSARVHDADRDRAVAEFRQIVSAGRRHDIEFRIPSEAGDRWLVARSIPEVDETGRVTSLPGVALDITAQKAAQAMEREAAETLRQSARRQQLRIELTDALRGLEDPAEIRKVASRMLGQFLGAVRAHYAMIDPVAAMVTIANGWVNGVSDIEGTFGFEHFGVKDIPFFKEGHPLRISDACTHWLTVDTYETSFGPMGIRAVVAVPILREGVLVALFGVHDQVAREWTDDELELIEDVAKRVWEATERLRAESDLRALNAALDETVRKRTAQLTRANREMESFNYSIAHDLRAPLRSVIATSRILLEEVGGSLANSHLSLLERQIHNANRLSSLIDALLNLSRLSRGSLERAEIDLTALAYEVAETYTARDGKCPCALVVSERLRTIGDPRLVRLVMQNLIENAIKFSPHGGTIRVGEDEPGTYFVADEGIGFDMQYVGKIFSPFERLVGERDFPGTGIGLANVHRIIERHGGRVWAQSTPGQGSTFSFTLA